MHWSNPPHVIPMIEVIPGERTSAETTATAVALVERIGYEAVVEGEVPGFVENRILYAIMREAVDLVDRGIIDADGMDRCVRWGIGYKLAVIGPMELLDMAGLDIYQAVGSYLNKDLCNGTEVSKTITDRTAAGNLGMKTGSGLYDYTPERINELRAMRARKLVAVRKALSDQEGDMKIWLLDNGSIVIDHAQLMWNIGGGTPVRIPSYGVLIEHDDGLFLFDTGFDCEHTNRVLPFELPEQTDEQTIPAQLARVRLRAGGRDRARQLAPALRPRAAGTSTSRTRSSCCTSRSSPEARELRAVRALRLLGPDLGPRGPRDRDASRATSSSRRACGSSRPRGTRSATTRCSRSPPAAGRAMLFAVDVVYTAEAFEKGVQPGFHYDPVAGVRSIQRLRDLAAEHDAEILFSHDMDAWNGYKHAPDAYEL